MRLSRALVLPAAVALVVATAAPAVTAAAPATAAAAASVRVTGSGFGHGHGMSQYGAQAAAVQGLGHRQILAFYYPTLKAGTAAGDVEVLITSDTSDDVVVVDRVGLRVTSLGSGKTFALDTPATARTWRIRAASGGQRSTIAWKAASGGWRTSRTVPGQAQFSAGGRPITLVTPLERRAYRGVLRSAAPTASSGRRDTVNVLTLDSYLKGVVPREVFASWRPAALRAQAVAARTYAAFDRADGNASSHWQICDTTQCQVYGGFTDEVASTSRAIDDTRGQVLTSDGAPAFTQFSASNGGWTSAGSQPYLVAKQDPYDKAYRNWQTTVTGAAIERALPGNGAFRSATVVARDGKGLYGGRVERIRLTFAQRSTVISGDDFRSYFGLMSSMFKVS